MSHIDWDSYLDESMPAADLAALNAQLAADPKLQKDLSGFKAFKEETRKRALAQPVPVAMLESNLQRIAKPAKPTAPPRGRWVMRLIPLGAIGLAYLVATHVWTAVTTPTSPPSLLLNVTCSTAGKVTTDSSEGAQWLTEKTGIKVPPIKLEKSLAELSRVEYGDGWARMDFKTQEAVVHVTMSKQDSFDSAAVQNIDEMQFYTSFEGIGWRSDGLSFFLDGASPKTLLEVGCAIRKTRGETQHGYGFGTATRD